MLAWIDLEMTGLDPARHSIVEIATLITDDDLTIVEEGPDLVVHASPEQLAEMDEIEQIWRSSGSDGYRPFRNAVLAQSVGLDWIAL